LSDEIKYEVNDGVALVTLNAPERRNALSVQMCLDLIEATDTAVADPAVGALVVTGGEHFCAGAARAVLADTGKDPAEPTAYTNLETVYRSFIHIGTIGLPTIAAVRGAAVGAGLNLMMATDLRIVSPTARILPGFQQIGIHPGGGHFTLMNRTAGREATAALGLFGEEVTGKRAVELGLAWEAVEDAAVESRAHELAARVAKDPELARRVVLAFRRQTAPGGLPWDVAVEMERAPQMWSLRRKHGA
jgi:enoyl-CoA hydratase